MEKVVAPKVYFGTCIALLALLALTRVIAYVDLGPFNLIVALAVAITKAILIALLFMHIKGSSRVLHLAALAGVILAAVPDLPDARRLSHTWLGTLESLKRHSIPFVRRASASRKSNNDETFSVRRAARMVAIPWYEGKIDNHLDITSEQHGA